MKKFLLASVGAAALCASNAFAADYTVYNNGTVADGLRPEYWWNAAVDFQAADPTGGSDKVLKFNASGAQGATTDASMGLLATEAGITGPLHNATLNFDWYATGTGKYTIRLTDKSQQDAVLATVTANSTGWQTATFNIAEKFPTVAAEWDSFAALGEGYVFAIILEQGNDAAIYFKNIYYSNIDESWEAPEIVIAAPENVPSPIHPASDVVSLLSEAYTPATTFNIGQWGQSTKVENKVIAGQTVEYLFNFNYLGWELPTDGHIDVSDCEYMHVDFWTEDGTAFGFTPISNTNNVTKERSWIVANNGATIVPNEWNSYDVPLTFFSQNDGVDLSNIFQVKFDQGNGFNCYIANVYFWKESDGETEVPSKLYLIGDTRYLDQTAVEAWNPQSPLEFTSGTTEGTFTLTGVQFGGNEPHFTFVNTTGTWDEINAAQCRYGSSTNLTSANLYGTNPFMLVAAGDEASWSIASGVYDFTVDFNTMTYTVSVSDVAPVVPGVPEKLYVMGNIKDNQWEPLAAPELTGDESGVFEISSVTFEAPEGSSDCWFTFINILSDDWSVIGDGSHRYGPAVSGTDVSFDEPNPFDLVNDSSWKVAPGTYDLAVDFNTMSVTIAVSQSEGVANVAVDANAPVEYFNLQGVRVLNPENGIFIRRQGSTVSKVIVK